MVSLGVWIHVSTVGSWDAPDWDLWRTLLRSTNWATAPRLVFELCRLGTFPEIMTINWEFALNRGWENFVARLASKLVPFQLGAPLSPSLHSYGCLTQLLFYRSDLYTPVGSLSERSFASALLELLIESANHPRREIVRYILHVIR